MSLKHKVSSLYEVSALGPQLLIIDVQETFGQSAYEILPDILKYARGFDEILYVYDVMSEEEHTKQFDMFKELKDSGHLRARMQVHDKEFGFIRDLMDSNWSDEEIQDIVRFMVKHKLHDMRDIQHKNLTEEWKQYADSKGLDEYDPESDPAFLPDYIYDLLPKVKPGAHLVGGGRNECLKEIELVLEAVGKRPKVIERLTYGS